jgi:autotransporter-associated beta strand protein
MIYSSLFRKLSLPFIFFTVAQSTDVFGQSTNVDEYIDPTPPPAPEEVIAPPDPATDPNALPYGILEIKTDTLLTGLSAGSGIVRPSSEAITVGPVELTLEVPKDIALVYGGVVLPHDPDGNVALHLIKTGAGSQELAGVNLDISSPFAPAPKLTVLDGTLIISGNFFQNTTEPWTKENAVQVVTRGTLEIRHDWNPASGGVFNQLSGDAKNILIEGGTLKFTGNNQVSSRGFKVGSLGATLWTDANFTKTLAEGESATSQLIAGNAGGGGSVTLTGTAGSIVIGGIPNGGSELIEVVGSQGDWQENAKLIKQGSGYWKIAGSNLGGGIEVHDGILTIAGPSQTAGAVKIFGGQLNLQDAVAAGTGTVTISQGRLKIEADGYANDTVVEGGVVELGGHRSEAKLTLAGGRVTGGENFEGEALVQQSLDASSNLGGLGGGRIRVAAGAGLTGQGKIGNVILEAGSGIFLKEGLGPLQMSSLQLQGDNMIKLDLFNFGIPQSGNPELLQINGVLDLRQVSAANPLKIKLSAFIPEDADWSGVFTESDLVRFSLIKYETLLMQPDVGLSDLISLDLSDFDNERWLKALGAENLLYSLSLNPASQLIELSVTAVPEPSSFASACLVFFGGVMVRNYRQRKATGAAARCN